MRSDFRCIRVPLNRLLIRYRVKGGREAEVCESMREWEILRRVSSRRRRLCTWRADFNSSLNCWSGGVDVGWWCKEFLTVVLSYVYVFWCLVLLRFGL